MRHVPDFDSSDVVGRARRGVEAAAAAAVDAEEQALEDLFDSAFLGAGGTDFGSGFLDAGASDGAASDGGLFDVGAPGPDASALGAGLFGSEGGSGEDIGLGCCGFATDGATDGGAVTSSPDGGLTGASSPSDLLGNVLQVLDPAAELDPLQALVQSLLSAASGFDVSPDELSADDLGNVLGEVSGTSTSTFLDSFSSSGDASFVDFTPTTLMSNSFGSEWSPPDPSSMLSSAQFASSASTDAAPPPGGQPPPSGGYGDGTKRPITLTSPSPNPPPPRSHAPARGHAATRAAAASGRTCDAAGADALAARHAPQHVRRCRSPSGAGLTRRTGAPGGWRAAILPDPCAD